MGIRIRLIAAIMAAAMLTAMAGAATAEAARAKSPTPTSSSAKEEDGADKDAVVAKVAASLHVSVRQLVTALDHLKQAIGGGTAKDAAVRAFARELKVTVADAEKALQALSGNGRQKPDPGKDKQPGVPDELVKLLAGELHITADRARQVFTDLDKVKANGEDAVKDPAFIAIAKGLGITPQRLLTALITVKQEAGGVPKEKVPSGSPTK
jgi:hypothetical protein